MRHILLSVALALGVGLAPLPGHAAPAAPADKSSARDRILGALDLPLKAHALRKAGVDEPGVKAGLKAARDKQLNAKDAAELLDVAATAVKEHGPVDNFGAFVQTQLAAGLRGKELAAAIRSEHASRGKGKPDGKGKSDEHGPPDGKGKSDEHGPPDGAGAADGKGPQGDKGPPDGKGKPDDKGTPDVAGAQDGKGPPDGKGKPDDDAPDDKGKPEGKGKGASKDK